MKKTRIAYYVGLACLQAGMNANMRKATKRNPFAWVPA